MQPRRLIQGSLPLVVSIPHMGTYLPPDIKSRMTPAGRALPDTDWHLDRLYDFAAAMGASVLMSVYSRYVVDLNRPADDAALYAGQVKTGLVPLETFDGAAIYAEGEAPDDIEKINRVSAYWLPYHETLAAEIARVRDAHGYCIVYDAHSIRSKVPRLFEGELPALNLGTVHGKSCDAGLSSAVYGVMQKSGYTAVENGRFIGGHITRHYGDPEKGVHALQMEIAQKHYMDEETFAYDAIRAAQLQLVLRDIFTEMIGWRHSTI